LRLHRQPLRAGEIVHHAQEEGLFSQNMFSRTPQKSMQARISLDIIKNGKQSKFVRLGRGLFSLQDSELKRSSESLLGGKYENIKVDNAYVAVRRQPTVPRERVLVIPEKHYHDVLSFQGFRPDDGTLCLTLLAGADTYIARTEAEEISGCKQVITYVIVTHGTKVLSFKRGRFNRAAEFLRSSMCIGFGGHVSEIDRTIFSFNDSGVRANAERELREELKFANSATIVKPDDFQCVGIINDDSNEVGRRHVGIVLQYDIADRDWSLWESIQRGEASINQLQWIDIVNTNVDISRYEYWSQLCWRAVFPVVVSAQPAYRVIRKKPFGGPHVLLVVGTIGSGKTLASQFLSRSYGYALINSGRVVSKIAGIAPIPQTPRLEFQEKVWQFIRKQDGARLLGEELLGLINKSTCSRILIDGVRQVSTLRLLREKSRLPVALLFIYASPDVAYELYAGRGESESKTGPDAFMKMFGALVEREIPFMASQADVVVYNWSGKAKLSSVLSAMADELGLKGRTTGNRL
jgi:predicted NUDIX family phosphoesterase/uncharacterized membrane protein